MQLRRCTGLVVLAFFLSGYKPVTDPAQPRIVIQEVNPWTHLQLNNDPEHFQFAIVSDRTGGARPGVFEDGLRKLDLLQPEFIMSVGDLIQGYTEDLDEIRRQWTEFEGFVEGLGMPFFYLPGNHDITNQVMAAEWEQRFGRSYYHFVYRDVLFLCLNSEDPPPTHISAAQIEYASQVLEANPDVRWTLVFLHKPLWVYEDETGWSRIEKMLEDRRHTVFAGHFHTYTKYERHGQNYFILATTGGGSSLRGPVYGHFDHVVWVTMTGQGPQVANLMLEGIWDEDVRTEEIATLVNPLIRGGGIGLAPIFVEGEHFERGRSRLRLQNDADRPLQFEGGFAPQAGLQIRPLEVEIEIPPNEVKWVDLEVEAAKPLLAEKVEPLVLTWKAAYERKEKKPIEVEGEARLTVEQVYGCAARQTPVVVDGKLDEWKELPLVCRQPAQILVAPESWVGPEDCFFRFGVEYDQEYLYIAVEVVDEQPVLFPEKLPWKQDGIEVLVDARPDPVRSNSRGQGLFENFLFIGLSPGATPGEMVFYKREQVVGEGVQAICAKTDGGHNTEIAIPLSYLDEKQGHRWEEFRLNIGVDDFDDPAGKLAQIWWQPNWRRSQDRPGSGTFKRR